MPLFALGNVQPQSTTTGLPATQNAPTLFNQPITALFTCRALQFQALAANSGSVFICDRATPDLTKNVWVEIPPPSTNPVTRPVWVVADPVVRTAYNAAAFFILPAVIGEGVRVTAVREPTHWAGGGTTVPGALSALILACSAVLQRFLLWLNSN